MLHLDLIALFPANQQIVPTNRDGSSRLDQIAVRPLWRVKVHHIDTAPPEYPEHVVLLQVLKSRKAATFLRHREPFAVGFVCVQRCTTTAKFAT